MTTLKTLMIPSIGCRKYQSRKCYRLLRNLLHPGLTPTHSLKTWLSVHLANIEMAFLF